ncbi:four helix bundle protein [Patescibacteria group bacterium]|nr:four helix bundle protein [Patescibacteria group bacterium]
MMMIHSYCDLIVWQKSSDLVEAVYELVSHFPQSELYELSAQMRRSAVSIPSNIAEGRRKKTRKDYCNFLQIAYGSGGELEAQIILAKRLPFGRNLDYSKVDDLLNQVMRMLNKMLCSLRQPAKSNKPIS